MTRFLINGELVEVKDPKAIEELKKVLGRGREYIENDELNVTLAYMMKKGYVIAKDKHGRDITKEHLEVFENTMKLVGITWDMIEELFEEE